MPRRGGVTCTKIPQLVRENTYIPELYRVGESLHLVREFRIRSPLPFLFCQMATLIRVTVELKKDGIHSKKAYFSLDLVFFPPFPPPLGPFVENPRSYTRSVLKKSLHSPPPPSALALTACFVFFGLWIYACDLLFFLFFAGNRRLRRVCISSPFYLRRSRQVIER